MSETETTAATGWRYSVDDCDVPESRHGRLEAYREFRAECLDCLHGSTLSVSNQLVSLAYYTTIFRTLNESSEQHINNVLWQLGGAGYASLLAAGIRRMIDRDDRTMSLWWVLERIEKRPELLTRELYVCHDGLPFDWRTVQLEVLSSVVTNESGIGSFPLHGARGWAESRRMHDAFDELMEAPLAGAKRRRLDVMSPGIIGRLKEELKAPSMDRLHTWADRRMLHAERLTAGEVVETPSFEDVTDAIHRAARVLQFVSTNLFWDRHVSNAVPSMNFNWSKQLTIPWASIEQLPAIKAEWKRFSKELDQAMDGDGRQFLPARQTPD